MTSSTDLTLSTSLTGLIDLHGRRALVTGGAKGIGAAISARLAEAGAHVMLADMDPTGQSTADALTATGLSASFVVCDITDPKALVAAVDAACDGDALDILVNNAGIYLNHPPLMTSASDWLAAWQQTLATNLQGPAHLSLLATQAMAARAERHGPTFGRGRIVNISSRGAFRGEPDAPAYAASKAGLNALSQSLARALAAERIYVYCLAPGWVETDMAAAQLAGPEGAGIRAQHPLGRVTRPDELANAVVYCALDAPAAMTGGIIDVNGASYLRT